MADIIWRRMQEQDTRFTKISKELQTYIKDFVLAMIKGFYTSIYGEDGGVIRSACHMCGKEHEGWHIPDEFWQRVPEELWGKHLCYPCYLSKITEK